MNLGNESETVEFKKSTGEHKEALQAMSAMLNKHGRGELYFGVKDNGEVIGQDATDATIRQIAGWISDKVDSPISPTIDRLADEDAKAYIRVAFSGMDAPYSADGRYFTRVWTSNKQMAASELTTMIIERDRARNPGTRCRPAGPSKTSTRRPCASSSRWAKRQAASETGRPTRQACSSASACLPRTARSPTPAP